MIILFNWEVLLLGAIFEKYIMISARFLEMVQTIGRYFKTAVLHHVPYLGQLPKNSRTFHPAPALRATRNHGGGGVHGHVAHVLGRCLRRLTFRKFLDRGSVAFGSRGIAQSRRRKRRDFHICVTLW